MKKKQRKKEDLTSRGEKTITYGSITCLSSTADPAMDSSQRYVCICIQIDKNGTKIGGRDKKTQKRRGERTKREREREKAQTRIDLDDEILNGGRREEGKRKRHDKNKKCV